MALYPVNVYSFRPPNYLVFIFFDGGAARFGSDYRGYHGYGGAFRQLAIVADSVEEALEKAKSIEVGISHAS